MQREHWRHSHSTLLTLDIRLDLEKFASNIKFVRMQPRIFCAKSDDIYKGASGLPLAMLTAISSASLIVIRVYWGPIPTSPHFLSRVWPLVSQFGRILRL